ncbi:hypothetical protein MTO96_000182 [Rhipicephalus appendiculatus]
MAARIAEDDILDDDIQGKDDYELDLADEDALLGLDEDETHTSGNSRDQAAENVANIEYVDEEGNPVAVHDGDSLEVVDEYSYSEQRTNDDGDVLDVDIDPDFDSLIQDNEDLESVSSLQPRSHRLRVPNRPQKTAQSAMPPPAEKTEEPAPLATEPPSSPSLSHAESTERESARPLEDEEEEEEEGGRRGRFQTERRVGTVIATVSSKRRQAIPDSLDAVISQEDAAKIDAYLSRDERRPPNRRGRGRGGNFRGQNNKRGGGGPSRGGYRGAAQHIEPWVAPPFPMHAPGLVRFGTQSPPQRPFHPAAMASAEGPRGKIFVNPQFRNGAAGLGPGVQNEGARLGIQPFQNARGPPPFGNQQPEPFMRPPIRQPSHHVARPNLPPQHFPPPQPLDPWRSPPTARAPPDPVQHTEATCSSPVQHTKAGPCRGWLEVHPIWHTIHREQASWSNNSSVSSTSLHHHKAQPEEVCFLPYKGEANHAIQVQCRQAQASVCPPRFQQPPPPREPFGKRPSPAPPVAAPPKAPRLEAPRMPRKQSQGPPARTVNNANIKEVPILDYLPPPEPEKATLPPAIEEDAATQELRRKIEEQKKLREQVMRIKEERRKLAVMQRQKDLLEQRLQATAQPPVVSTATSAASTPAEKPQAVASTSGTPVPANQMNTEMAPPRGVGSLRGRGGATIASRLGPVRTAGLTATGTAGAPRKVIRIVSNNGRLQAVNAAGAVGTMPPRLMAPGVPAMRPQAPGTVMMHAAPRLPNTAAVGRVLVSNLSASTNENSLRHLGRSCGEIILDKNQRQAVVKFREHQQAVQFQKKYQRHMLDLSMIQVSLLPP